MSEEEKKPIEEKATEKSPDAEVKAEEKPVEVKVEEKPVEAVVEMPAEVPEPTTAEVKEEKPAEAIVETPVEASAPTPPEVKEEKPPEEPRIEGAVNKGDFILIEMTGRAEETGESFDTTSEEVAREKGIYKEDRVYGPRLVVVGEGWVLRGLDAKLRGIKPNEQTSIEIPPGEAFGERDPANIQLIPYRILRSKGVNPVVGAELEIDNRNAVIRSVAAGRVQVDYNHPLAGRKIIYDVKVTKIIEDETEKINSLINRRFVAIDPTKFSQSKSDKKMIITIPDEIFFGENIQIAKRGLAMDVLKYFPELEEVDFLEIVKKP